MARVSEKKLILDEEKYLKLKNPYNQLVDELELRFSVTDNPENSSLVNFKDNFRKPKHNWLKYKEGYASKLVQNLLATNEVKKNEIILDPFCGVGTTNLVAQQNGFKSVGFDINPIALLAAKCKTEFYTKEDIFFIKKHMRPTVDEVPFCYSTTPKVLLSSFSEDVLEQILIIKNHISKVPLKKVRDFLNLAFISIIEDCSIRVKDGNGIKLKRTKRFVTEVQTYFEEKIEEMLSDIEVANYRTEVSIFEKSAIEPHYELSDRSVSLCVFSPPYANCFDYLEVYKLEVWLGGFADEYDDFRKYRNKAMRSHVNSKFDHNFQYSNIKVETIAELIAAFNIWNKNIPDMLKGYFDDMHKLLVNLHPKMTNEGKIYIVVANSVYKGVIVPTDLLIAEIAQIIGFKVLDIKVARKIRSSSQQIPEIRHNNLMRETIIEIQK